MVRQPWWTGRADWADSRQNGVVAVGVEDRDEEQIGLAQQPGLTAERNVAEQHHAGVLAVDLAGMDAALHQHGRFAGGWQSADIVDPFFG